MQTRRMKFLLWFVILVLVMACAPALATPFPTVNPGAINTFIAQTANAAASQTAAVLPTNTSTETPTPTPENTQTPSLTPTSTVIFVLFSPTAIPTFTSFVLGNGGGSGTGAATSSENLACAVMSVSPPNGTTFDPRANFDTTWRLKNIGQNEWDHNSVDVVYESGARIHQVASFDLERNVRVGDIINITVGMKAPNVSGAYTTNWVLQASANVFCKMTLNINVR